MITRLDLPVQVVYVVDDSFFIGWNGHLKLSEKRSANYFKGPIRALLNQFHLQ